ncbi:MAG: hypothetical protein ACYTGL_28530 [Planctomycetota bacterium]|jgi:hypothetical protein
MNVALTNSWHGFAVCLFAVLCTGCGSGNSSRPTGEVEGIVTLNGQPLPDGGISFYDDATGHSAGGTIENGKFVITDPVEAGNYKVAVHPPAPVQPDDQATGEQASADAALIPEGYQDESASGLTATVVEGPNSFQFALSPDGPAISGGDQFAP